MDNPPRTLHTPSRQNTRGDSGGCLKLFLKSSAATRSPRPAWANPWPRLRRILVFPRQPLHRWLKIAARRPGGSSAPNPHNRGPGVPCRVAAHRAIKTLNAQPVATAAWPDKEPLTPPEHRIIQASRNLECGQPQNRRRRGHSSRGSASIARRNRPARTGVP